jgi:hypothetical protein
MKSLHAHLCIAIVILSIVSCQKQITDKDNEIPSSTMTSSNNNCKPVGLGIAMYNPDLRVMVWKNVLLKWYDSQGKLKNIKIDLGWDEGTGIYDALVVQYGEIRYEANEVHLRDIYYNQEILTAKLDNQGRPIISWYNSYGRTHDYQYDTSYYSYSSLDRLESIVQHRRMPGSNQTSVQTWNFNYDPDGNLNTILPQGSYGGYEFRYDYTRLYNPIVTTAIFSAPVKALEYMDLLSFQHHHHLNAMFYWAPNGTIDHTWGYWNPRTNANGNVEYYGFFSPAIYTAWACGEGTNMLQSKNPSKEEFLGMLNNK